MERPGMTNRMQALIGVGVFFIFVMGMSSVAVAADGDGVAEAAPSQDTALQDATRDQILQTIDATRQADPELAAEMERQLHLIESGDAAPTPTERELQGGAVAADPHGSEPFGFPGGATEATGAPELIGPPVDGPKNFEQVQSDPRMDDVRRQFEGGQLSEDQAREKVFEVLRDHGVEPNDGREWERQGERGEGFERAFERMSSEGREHAESMERMFEHEGERPEVLRETSERELGMPERSLETPVREYEVPTREYETPTRESDMLERMPEGSEPSHEYETPPHH